MSKTCDKIVLDKEAMMRDIKNHLLKSLIKAEDQLLSQMEKEVLNTTYKDAPGKPEWRKMVHDKLEVVEEIVADDYMQAKVGLDTNILFTDFLKAMIVAYGSGNRVGNGSIEAGPPGRIVWDGNMDGQHPSREEGNWLLPEEFNQTGNHFIRNAVMLMRKHFKDVLDEASVTLPSSVFYRNVHVKGGSR